MQSSVPVAPLIVPIQLQPGFLLDGVGRLNAAAIAVTCVIWNDASLAVSITGLCFRSASVSVLRLGLASQAPAQCQPCPVGPGAIPETL